MTGPAPGALQAWVGYFGEPGVSPPVNEVYYINTGFAVLARPCSGGAYVHTEIALPSFTQLAISDANPVICWFKAPSASNYARQNGGCPRNGPTSIGIYGGLSFDPTSGGAAWPMGFGAAFEIWIPVKTTRPLSGLITSGSTGCPSCLYAGTWMIDGVVSPWLFPVQGINVIDATPPPAPQPYVDYPAPNHYQDSSVPTQWWTAGFVFTEGTSGVIYSDLREKGGPWVEAPGVPVPAGAWRIDQPWNPLQAGRTYEFRVCYDPTGNLAERCGAIQTFKVPNPSETNPPETSIVTKPKKLTNSTSASFTFESDELGSTFRCVRDGGVEQDCGVTTFTGLLEGTHTLSVVAVDPAGNRDPTPATYSWTVDLTNPMMSTLRVTKSGNDVTLRFSANERGTFLCQRGSGSFTKCSSPKTYANLPRGMHTFTLRPKDRAGNVGDPLSKSVRV